MIIEMMFCVAVALQVDVTLPVWEAQTPTYRTTSTQLKVSWSENSTCTVALTADGNTVFINATGIRQGQPVKVSIQMSYAKDLNGNDVVTLYYDNRPNNELTEAPMDLLDDFSLPFMYIPQERLRWFMRKYPKSLKDHSVVIPIKLVSASAPIPKATNPCGMVAVFLCYLVAAAGLTPGTGQVPGITTPLGLCSIVSSTRE